MTNPAGINQLNRTAATGYGDVKKQTQLTKEAPISGAPRAAQALNTPRRSQKQAQRKSLTGQAGPPPEQQPGPAPQPTYEAQLGQLWNQLAGVPGASPLVAEYAQDAQGPVSR